ncbi:MAG TPA: hypothetical protein VJP08_02360 [Actinomycetota bacterium]|nr:hypothetical protein [Actinomycetota bacterium]
MDPGSAPKGRAGAGGATVSPVQVPEAERSEEARETQPSEPEPRGSREAPEAERREPAARGEPEPRGGPEASGSGKRAHAPEAGAVDAEMLRRSWPEVLEALKARRKMVLFASAQVATVGSFEGETIELVFPPGREVGAAKVEERSADLIEVLQELFGIAPTVRCTVRQGTAVEATEDEPPPSPEAAEALVRAQFGAEVVEEE